MTTNEALSKGLALVRPIYCLFAFIHVLGYAVALDPHKYVRHMVTREAAGHTKTLPFRLKLLCKVVIDLPRGENALAWVGKKSFAVLPNVMRCLRP